MRREQTDEDRAPVDRGRERRDEEDDAHEHNDAREDLLDDLVRADPHARKTQDGDDHDDGYHGSRGLRRELALHPEDGIPVGALCPVDVPGHGHRAQSVPGAEVKVKFYNRDKKYEVIT